MCFEIEQKVCQRKVLYRTTGARSTHIGDSHADRDVRPFTRTHLWSGEAGSSGAGVIGVWRLIKIVCFIEAKSGSLARPIPGSK